ncbi:MAG: N-acetylmuramoyl-L-alanine amidase [Erysipelotrichales bacterium]|nr:N-acetylmuramoyl-L-alanine amidase [Erysipelotrichales bacterium]
MKQKIVLFLMLFLLFGCSVDPKTINNTIIYELPSTTSKELITIPENTNVVLSFKVYNWCRVTYQEITGYTECSNLDLPPEEIGVLSGKTVIVDAGHGGKDNGAIVDNVLEKDINRKVSDYLIEYLKEDGANVVETRKNDETLYLYDRPTIANLVVAIENYIRTTNSGKKDAIGTIILDLEAILNDGVDVLPYLYRKGEDMNEELKEIFELTNQIDDVVFVSIHSNVTGNEEVSLQGLDMILTGNNVAEEYPGYDLYNDAERELFGNILGQNISSEADINLRRVYFGDYAVLREENLPSTLIELGYMDNEEDLKKLTDSDSQKAYARGIEKGIIEYFEATKTLTQ